MRPIQNAYAPLHAAETHLPAGSGGDGQEICFTADNDTFVFHNVCFAAGATCFTAEARIGSRSGWIDIWVDGMSGEKAGVCQLAARDLEEGAWGPVKAGVYVSPGTHDLYLRLRGFGQDDVAIKDIRFAADRLRGIELGGVALPARAPWLGPIEDYFMGNGSVGGGGNTNGVWDYLIGPGYTFYGYIKSHESFLLREEILVKAGGRVSALDFGMRRVRGTGMFHGVAEAGALRVDLVEYANCGEPWVSRLIRVENRSDAAQDAEVLASLLPSGDSHSTVGGNTVTVAHGCDAHPSGKHATIGFNGPAASARWLGEVYELSSGILHLAPCGREGSVTVTALLHGMHLGDGDAARWAHAVGGTSAHSLLAGAGRCMLEWQAWFAGGDPLGPQGRTRDLLEGALAILRMLQGCDGGIMATARSYMDSYIRDSAGALRGLTAFGFTAEAERFLRWAHRKFELHHAIVCNANIGDDANWFPGYGGEDNWAAESPALYLLAARDYFQRMDRKGRGAEAQRVLEELDASLRFAAGVQVASLVKNGWKLRFNGDETESGGSGIPLQDRPVLDRYWSMPSLALCVPSLEFFSAYIQRRGEDPCEAALPLIGGRVDLGQVTARARDSMDRMFWREDLADYPEGFYDWYRSDTGAWPERRITNYSLFPLCYGTVLNRPERAAASALAMKRHYSASGYMPIQPGGLNEGFCGHNLGYLLHALTAAGDQLAADVFESLTAGGTMGCWGTWSEAYTGDGVTHTLPGVVRKYRAANMRPFETGINIAAIRYYMLTRA